MLVYGSTFYCNVVLISGVRIAATESLPYLLECAKIRGPEYLSEMWQYICPELLKAVDTEPEVDIQAEHMHALAQVHPTPHLHPPSNKTNPFTKKCITFERWPFSEKN